VYGYSRTEEGIQRSSRLEVTRHRQCSGTVCKYSYVTIVCSLVFKMSQKLVTGMVLGFTDVVK